MDWDKLRVFHAAAESGSFTRAAETLDMSQSAVSRQVSAIEGDLDVLLFHRHARGLMLTEQGEMLYRAAHDIKIKLDATRARLQEARDKPSGTLRVTTTVGLGSTWLTDRLHEFVGLYPEIGLELVLENEELDLSMRQADVAIRLKKPTQPDLIQRRLFTVHFHIYVAQSYIDRYGKPGFLEDLDNHRIITFGVPVPAYLRDVNWLEVAGRSRGSSRRPVVRINNVIAIRDLVRQGVGIATLPDYLVERASDLVRILPQAEAPSFETYLVYPSELRHSGRIGAFRDFLVEKARTWSF